MTTGNVPGFVVRGVWCDPDDAGRVPESVEAFVERLHQAGINLVVMCVKDAKGEIFWPSDRFPHTVAEGYAEFDLPAALLAACRARGMQFHAWFIDFMEGKDGPAFTEHPEWAMRNPEGETTASEVLRGKPYHSVWMCPARRPGYADQWLIPMMAEFAERYAVDAIHHDYIRYPGDLAPDRYCFCDACLEDIPRYAGFASDIYPDEPFYHETYNRPYLESHWEQSPRVLPGNWAKLPRQMKSRFLLEGSFFHGGRPDLDYFFYRYRIEAIDRFVRQSFEELCLSRGRHDYHIPNISAAVFKDPVQSGRFLGQDWREWALPLGIAMPMNYRDHYPGDFEQYLVLLEESIGRQIQVTTFDETTLWPGIAINFLYKEEHAAGIPPGDVSPQKFLRTVDRIRATGVSGICLFSERQINRYGFWDAVREAFGKDAGP